MNIKTGQLETIEELAIRPFKLLQHHGLPSGYERSFKLSGQTISANRYLLGVDISLLNEPVLTQICTDLGMPNGQFDELMALKNNANLVLFGFDENNTDPIYKVYLEFWDQIKSEISSGSRANTAKLMHRGFKWRCLNHQSHVNTDYYYLAKGSHEVLMQRMLAAFPDGKSYVYAQSQDIVRKCFNKRSDAEYIFLQVSEETSERRSFDINLYPADLKVKDIEAQISLLADHLAIDHRKVERLMQLVEDKPLGHISAGCGRNGEEYLTVYYEQ